MIKMRFDHLVRATDGIVLKPDHENAITLPILQALCGSTQYSSGALRTDSIV